MMFVEFVLLLTKTMGLGVFLSSRQLLGLGWP